MTWSHEACGRTDVGPWHGIDDDDPCPVDDAACDRGRLCLVPDDLARAVSIRVASGETSEAAELAARCAECPTRPDEGE